MPTDDTVCDGCHTILTPETTGILWNNHKALCMNCWRGFKPYERFQAVLMVEIRDHLLDSDTTGIARIVPVRPLTNKEAPAPTPAPVTKTSPKVKVPSVMSASAPAVKGSPKVTANGARIFNVTEIPDKCHECDTDVVTRNGPRGKFYGCGAFPNCRVTYTLVEKDDNG